MKYVIIKTTNNRYLGASVWTNDFDRALLFSTKEAAQRKAARYINVKVIPVKYN